MRIRRLTPSLDADQLVFGGTTVSTGSPGAGVVDVTGSGRRATAVVVVEPEVTGVPAGAGGAVVGRGAGVDEGGAGMLTTGAGAVDVVGDCSASGPRRPSPVAPMRTFASTDDDEGPPTVVAARTPPGRRTHTAVTSTEIERRRLGPLIDSVSA
jgi:hypothetical protein